MVMARFLGLNKLLLGLTALSCCSALEVSIPQREYEVARGGEIEMTCSFNPARPNFNILILKWEVQPDKDNDPVRPVATYFLNTQTDIAPDYEGRANLFVDITTNQGKLRLTNVMMQDNRTFQCSVTIPGDDEGITAATTSLLVLVAPSKPVCRIQGDAEYGNNISIGCVSEEGSPSPAYNWQSYSVQNIERRFPPRTTEKDGVLSLYNISRETSGFLVCTSTNRIGSQSCNISLAVVPATINLGATAGIIGGIVAFLILAIVIYCCWRKKSKQDKYIEGSPEAVEFQDQPTGEVRKQYRDESSNSTTMHYAKESDHFEEGGVQDLGNRNESRVGTTGHSKQEADQHSYDNNKDDPEDGNVQSSERDYYRGSRDRLDDQRDHYRGSRDRLDDQRDHYRGSRDRLDDQRDHYRGSRDRLDDQREHYRGSRDRLDDHHGDIRGSRDRLDDQHDRYGSRDRLDAQPDRYGGSRDRLNDDLHANGSRPNYHL